MLIGTKMLYQTNKSHLNKIKIILLGLLLFLYFSTVACAVEKYALLIGIADYSKVPRLSSLDGTLNDIELTKQALLKKHLGFKADQIVILTDEKATHSGITKAMKALAAQVKKNDGGIVYIHYSGHGSLTRNFNTSEQEEFDQTWVSYGARTTLGAGIDQWDILDDEIREWLANISDHADQVILVSDSCHSGSITRGDSPAKTRAAMRDDRMHPLSKNNYRKDLPGKGVFIGAARDSEQAGEYMPDDTFYGLFTWYWIQSLEAAKPGETWNDLLMKTRIQVQGERSQQSPQISGYLIDAPVFEGAIESPEHHFLISEVNNKNKTVTIDHGTITGATVGSVYTLYNPDSSQETMPTLQLTSCTPFNCSGTILRGRFKAAMDLVIEEQHAYTIEPIKLYIDGDFAASGDLVVKELKSSFIDDPVPGYTLVDKGKPRSITLYLTRPILGSNSSYKYNNGELLPVSRPDMEPEVWILDNTNHLLHNDLRIPYIGSKTTWATIRSNLQNIAKAREIKRLSSVVSPDLNVDVTTWRAVPSCTTGDDCLKDRQGYFKKYKTFALSQIDKQNLREGDSLTFTVSNTGQNALYVYLLNIGPDNSIIVVYPHRNMANDEDVRLGRNSLHPIDTKRTGRLELSSGIETIKIIASEKPIAINRFAQNSYTRSGALKKAEHETRGIFNPLNNLIAAAVGGKNRGRQIFAAPQENEWGTIQISIDVPPTEK